MPGRRVSGRATIADVARRAGVSTATVSRVLNQTGPVARDMATTVHAAVAELDYTPRAAAQNLARGKTSTLGLLLPEIGGPFFSPLLRGIEEVARQDGYDLLIYATGRASGRGADQGRQIGQRNTDGALVFSLSLERDELLHLRELRFPMVLLLQSSPAGVQIPCVCFENRSGARRAVTHLIEVHGRRRIAFLRGPEGNSDSGWRELGYREALATHGIPFDSDLVASGGFDETEGLAAVEGLLMRGVTFDAIFAGDDGSAHGALQALRRRGLRVPEDVALAGFDDLHFSQYLAPPLTTVRAPIEEAGRRAARELISLIQTGQAAAEVLLPTELVVRGSCGCPWQTPPGF